MSSHDLLISPTGNYVLPTRPWDSPASDRKTENRSDDREINNFNEDGERMGKKRETSMKRKEMERLNRIHLRKGAGGGSADISPTKAQKQEAAQSRYSAHTNQSQEEISDEPKPKNLKKNPDESVSTSRFKRRSKGMGKSPDAKTNFEKNKKTGNKTKAVIAFGTTFQKSESEQPPLTKRRPSRSADRFGRSKRSKSRDGMTEEAGDEPRKDSSQSQLRPSKRHSSLKMSLSKNKLTEMLQEGDKEKGKGKGAFESTTGKRARSPYHTSSKIDARKPSSKVRIEGDVKNTGGKQDDKAEIGKDLSFFEKIQQNVKAYFSPKSSEIPKFEEEKKKVQEGETPENDESIKRGFKEDFMKGDQDFFMYFEKEKKSDSDKSCRPIKRGYFPGGKSARGNGSGPGGKITYSNGDTYNPSTEYQNKRLYYIKRRYECTEKPRTGSFHRSKTFQKNALAPSPPKSSTSISLILEPDEQVENFPSADGVASAFTQIQELHQEINPSVIQRSVNYARGTRSPIMQEDNLTANVNYLPGETTREPTKGRNASGCPPFRAKRIGSRPRRRVADVASSPKIAASFRWDIIDGRRTKSEGAFRGVPFAGTLTLHKDLPYRLLPKENVKLPAKQEKAPFIPRRRWWLVYSVTDTESIQTNRRESTAESSSGELEKSAEELGTEPECKKSKQAPIEPPKAKRKAEEGSPSVTLKDIISLSRKIFLDPEAEDPGTSTGHEKDGENSFILSHCLDELMEEKRNYLHLEKTKNLRKVPKANFISDSFNFFNLLNSEFLSLKSSNPRVEELRNVITKKTQPEMEEYLDMYKKVIRSSLTQPEQHLMDKAKLELERYTDMYYDLMKCICLEKEGSPKSLPGDKSSERSHGKINCEKKIKSKVGKKGEGYSDKAKPRTERSYYVTKMQETGKSRDSNIGKSYCRTVKRDGGNVAVRQKDVKVLDSKNKTVLELLRPYKNKDAERKIEAEGPEAEMENSPSSKRKTPLTRGLCDDEMKGESKSDPDRDQRGKPSLTRKDESSILEAFPESSQVKKSKSEHSAKEEPDVYFIGSIDECDDSENQVRQTMLKFRAFRKLLTEGLKYFSSLNETCDEDGALNPHRWVGRLEHEGKGFNSTVKSLEKDKKGNSGRRKIIGRRECVVDSPSRSTHQERVRKLLRRKRSGSFTRSPSPNKREDTKKKKRPWWRNDCNTPVNAGTLKQQKLHQSRKQEENKAGKKMSVLSKTTKEIEWSEDAKGSAKEAAEETLESTSEFATPAGSFLEMKTLKDLLHDAPSRLLNPGGLSEGKLMYPYEEERELDKLDLSGGDERGEGTLGKVPSSGFEIPKASLLLGFHNPLKAEWSKIIESSSQKDYEKVADVLNQFMGNVAEAWRAAACLKDLIQSATSNAGSESRKAEDARMPSESDKEDKGKLVNKAKAVETFRNFLRILTTVFERDPREEVVRRQLFLLQKELLENPIEAESPAVSLETGSRTGFAKEIAEIPRQIREMIKNELTSEGSGFAETEENFDPASFVAAVKNVGEKLKDIYFRSEGESQHGRSESSFIKRSENEDHPRKIYYRPPKRPSQEGREEPVTKSTLQNMAEKMEKIRKEKEQESVNEKSVMKKDASLDTDSSVYFDATDTIQHPGDASRRGEFDSWGNSDKVGLTSVDESYFSLDAQNFGKYRGLIYDKIITFLKSDNPSNINYGMALLGRMIDRDGNCSSNSEKKTQGTREEREKTWYHLLDKIVEICHVIEKEMKEQVEKSELSDQKGSERKTEIGRTCEYLKGYVGRMKSLIREIRSPDVRRSDGSEHHIKALDDSREANKERQLATWDSKFPVAQRHLLDNALDFINFLGRIGCSFDKFPAFLPKCFAGATTKEKIPSDEDPSRSEQLLEGNKAIVRSLKKKIEKRQRKIEDMLEEAKKEGVAPEDRLNSEEMMRKVRDLKRCYLLLQKMICDPTLLPPKWLKMEETEQKSRNRTKSEESSVMTMLENLMAQVSSEKKILGYSRPTILSSSKHTEFQGFRSAASVGSLTLVKINYATLNFECPTRPEANDEDKDVEEREKCVPLRPKTA